MTCLSRDGGPAPFEDRIAYLGPAGTFAHIVAGAAASEGADLIPIQAVEGVVQALVENRADFGVVTIEDPVEGMDTAVIDMLLSLSEPVELVVEISQQVSYDAYRVTDGGAEPTLLASHRRVLARCRRYAAANALTAVAFESTAGALSEAKRRPEMIALAAPGLEEAHGLLVRDRQVEDVPASFTRFGILAAPGRRRSRPAGVRAVGLAPKTMVALTPLRTGPGQLMEICTALSDQGIDIVSLTPRPLPRNPGAYVFVVVVDVPRESARLSRALTWITRSGIYVKHLGSYVSDYLEDGPSRPHGVEVPPGSLGALVGVGAFTDAFPATAP